MTEDEARGWIAERFGVSRETKLATYAEILRAESINQNLVSAASLATIWSRHLLDSAQLLPLAETAGKGSWVDVGSGAGLPGLVVAVLSDWPTVLVEPRGRRVQFLRDAISILGLEAQVIVQPTRIETYKPSELASVISARAVADLPGLLLSTVHCTNSSTVWLLPKGRTAHSEVEAAKTKWQGVFHVEPSITQPESGIVVARGVRPK
ncbi:16S rRNA (guanine(527)-N(7))-methyltransferase RsmG [Sphingomonas sp. M1-B02]|uniref:16S rRNA (guanine(527)-N(7))-methyltransferase RsmG n=1 Tax=Sphingomonas sp. M1-B02 TaxID=3114300 RepID=UPI00223F57BF|nr:16S rRNA (guanine(527)-N(7))-methyltransferase RsmG [Sphingomonas sp. S6-11]UZK65222.1 16S rRNA (guanine(527)-N(7))-methyltransferase RsmG [Sphingomonas sp. S6-11]